MNFKRHTNIQSQINYVFQQSKDIKLIRTDRYYTLIIAKRPRSDINLEQWDYCIKNNWKAIWKVAYLIQYKRRLFLFTLIKDPTILLFSRSYKNATEDRHINSTIWLERIQIQRVPVILRSLTWKHGPVRDLNPGPPAPKAGIIPLDQQAI